MVKKIVLAVSAVVLVLAIGLVTVIAMQPSEFHIERSATMSAPPEKVFAQVNDFHHWENWSPWLKVDPNAKGTYEGPSSGEGAIFRWTGNAEVGEGSMTITESRPHELIRIKLHFLKPMEDTATTDFTFQPSGDETKVTWSMDGRNNFIAKAMCLFVFDMEEMIGGKYEEGLASMKAIVEATEATSADESPMPIVETPSSDNNQAKGD
jgi:hypothetical protein